MVPAVVRAVRIVEAVAGRPGGLSAAQLARELGVPVASCFRIVRTLIDNGWLAGDGDGLHLGAAVGRLAGGIDPYARLIATAEPVLRRLAEDTGLAAKLSAREGGEQVTLSRVESPRPLAVTSRAGARYPVVQGASGACLLSDLAAAELAKVIAAADAGDWSTGSEAYLRGMIARARRHGVCENVGVHPQGIDTVAAPVRGEGGGVVAAITLVGLRGDVTGAGAGRIRTLVRAAAAECAAALFPGSTTAQRRKRGAA